MVANAAFNGIGAPLYGLTVSFMRCLGILLPTAWLLGEAIGARGIFIAISLSNLFAAVVAYRLLKDALRTEISSTYTLNPPNF